MPRPFRSSRTPIFSTGHALRRAKIATSCAKSTSVRSSRSRTRHRQRSHVWHGVGYRVPGENDSFGQNSIEFEPLLQKQLSRLWSAGEWLASIIICAPGFWSQTEAEIPGRGGGYGGQ